MITAPDINNTPLLNGGMDDAFPNMGDIQDIADHQANVLPPPGHSPKMQHSTKMAGDVIPFPISMKQSDAQRIKSMAKGGKGNLAGTLLRGPGSND